MAKYKIIWLDDDFIPMIQNPSCPEDKQINLRRSTLLEDAQLAADYEMEVSKASSFEQFEANKDVFGTFDAVILDLRGLDNKDSFNVRVTGAAKALADKYPGLLEYVYSANIDDPAFEITIGPLKDLGRCFSKALGPQSLFERIKADLDSKLNFYKGHEECLAILQEGFIDSAHKPAMNALLEDFAQKRPDADPYNDMRKIMENMLQKLDEYGDIEISAGQKPSFNSRLEYITKLCEVHTDKETGRKVIDYDKPLFPFEKCSREVKYVLSFLGDITNLYSHFLKDNPSYLRKNEVSLEYNMLLQQSVYPAFFLAMKWYYGYMTKYHPRES